MLTREFRVIQLVSTEKQKLSRLLLSLSECQAGFENIREGSILLKPPLFFSRPTFEYFQAIEYSHCVIRLCSREAFPGHGFVDVFERL